VDYVAIAADRIMDRYKMIVYGHPQLSDMPPGTIVGTWAYSVPHVARFILDREREMKPKTGVMPADVTRAWLNDVYKLPLRFRKSQVSQPVNRAPQLAHVGKWGECAYVDVSKAFRNIVSLGFDLEYVRDKYLMVRPVPLPDIVANTKMCYSLAVSISKNQESRVPILGKTGRIFTPSHFNVYSNPMLWLLALDSEAAIARMAVSRFGSAIHYINADGFIINAEKADALQSLIADCGLQSKVKAFGDTQVYGPGQWQCGEGRTKTLRPGKNIESLDVSLPTAKWLTKRLAKLSQLFYR
jgi:hypothetical protein